MRILVFLGVILWLFWREMLKRHCFYMCTALNPILIASFPWFLIILFLSSPTYVQEKRCEFSTRLLLFRITWRAARHMTLKKTCFEREISDKNSLSHSLSKCGILAHIRNVSNIQITHTHIIWISSFMRRFSLTYRGCYIG